MNRTLLLTSLTKFHASFAMGPQRFRLRGKAKNRKIENYCSTTRVKPKSSRAAKGKTRCGSYPQSMFLLPQICMRLLWCRKIIRWRFPFYFVYLSRCCIDSSAYMVILVKCSNFIVASDHSKKMLALAKNGTANRILGIVQSSRKNFIRIFFVKITESS